MDSGATGHVMREGMFARVMLERETSPERFVAASGEQIRDLVEKTVHSIQDKRGELKMHNIQKRECCQTFHFNAEKLSEPEALWGWMKRVRTCEIFEMER